jgi:hypothetical protein
VPAGERAVGGFSGLLGGGLSVSADARVLWGRERLGQERADGFDPNSVGRESRNRKPVRPACNDRRDENDVGGLHRCDLGIGRVKLSIFPNYGIKMSRRLN